MITWSNTNVGTEISRLKDHVRLQFGPFPAAIFVREVKRHGLSGITADLGIVIRVVDDTFSAPDTITDAGIVSRPVTRVYPSAKHIIGSGKQMISFISAKQNRLEN